MWSGLLPLRLGRPPWYLINTGMEYLMDGWCYQGTVPVMQQERRFRRNLVRSIQGQKSGYR